MTAAFIKRRYPLALITVLFLMSPFLLLAEATDQEAPATIRASLSDPCQATTQIESIEATADRLVVRTSAPVTPRMTQSGAVEKGFAGVYEVRVEIPRASLGGVSRRMELPGGLFSSMRAVQYRDEAECGVRLRLQLVSGAEWVIETTPEGFTVGPQRAPDYDAVSAPRGGFVSKAGGSAQGTVTHSATVVENGQAIATTQLQAGFAHFFPRFGLLRGFGSVLSPRQTTSSPYGAIGVVGFPLGPIVADAAAGDLFVSLGTTAPNDASFVNTLTIRGGGAQFFLPRRATLQVFGGYAASSGLTRLPGSAGRTVSEITEDRVYGGQIGWRPRSDIWGFAGGVVRSVEAVGDGHWNIFEAVERRTREWSARLIIEQSNDDASSEWGYAVTLEPRATTPRLSLGGYYRYISSTFEPPASASFFAGLRRSYSLFGGYRASSRLTASASFGQTKTFSIFDPAEVGTLNTSRAAGVAYQITRSTGLSAEYSETEVVSETGAILPADSSTTRKSVALTTRANDISASLRVAREDTSNRISPALGLQANRIELDLSRLFDDDGEVFSRFRYADSLRPGGGPAGPNYFGSVGVRAPSSDWATLRGEVGYSMTPAGVAGIDSRLAFASVGVQTGPAVRVLQGGAQITLQRLYVENEPARDAASFVVNATRLFDWGARPAPAAPYYSRAMPLANGVSLEMMSGRILVVAFEDANGNGIQERSEPGVVNLRVSVNGETGLTDQYGRHETRVAPGPVVVSVDPGSAALRDVILLDERPKTAAAIAFGLQRVDLPLPPAGKLTGQVQFQGSVPDPSVLQSIRVVARRGDLTLETLTDESGAFRFGALPAGTYTTALDGRSLPPDVILIEPRSVDAAVGKGQRSSVVFRVRRATTRERLLADQQPPAVEVTPAVPEPPPAEAPRVLDRAALLQIAQTLTELQQYRFAMRAFDRVLPLGADEAAYRYSYAVALYETGRYADAKRELRLALPAITRTPEVERYRVKIEGAIVP